MSTSERHLILDATNTAITFEVRWFGFVRVRGAFGRIHGVLQVGEDCLSHSAVRLDVEAGSVATGIGLRDRHLRGPRFLFADLHPFISFRSSNVRLDHGRLLVAGTLSLRGHEVAVASSCPIDDIDEARTVVDLCGTLVLSRRAFDVGVPRGLAAMNPLFAAIADDVHVRVAVRVPIAALRPALQASRR